MNTFTGIFLFLSAEFLLTECTSKAGVKVRLTKKGLKYALDFSKNVMEHELMKKTLTTSGKRGRISYKLKNMKITEVDFSNSKLLPIENVGLSAEFPGISLKGRGIVWYRYTSGWFPISDTVDVSVTVSNADISTVMGVIVTSGGRPDIEIKSCKAKVGDVNLHFHGSGFKTWLYNMFSPFVEKKLKDKINAMFCKLIRKKILEKARPRLENFPVLKKIGEWAEVDYTLMQPPVFGQDYMDIYLKGEFRSLSSHKEKRLVPSLFSPQSTDHEKMVYVWVSEYTFNTAGEVFNGYSKFEETLTAWDDKVPQDIRKFLNTDKFKFAIPNLFSYPDLPMSVRLVPYKASKVVINEGNLDIFLHAHATFSLKYKNGTIFEAFKLQVDIDTTGTINIKNNKELTGKITDFNYKEKVLQSNIGRIISPLNNAMFKIIIETVVISHANSILAKGFPLPNLDNIDFQNTDVMLQKGAIRIGTDIIYKMD